LDIGSRINLDDAFAAGGQGDGPGDSLRRAGDFNVAVLPALPALKAR